MPVIKLTKIEARILGSLVEKSLTTPDQYPLSLNALVNACNQKSSRDPVMSLDEASVVRALATLQSKGLVDQRNEPGSRVVKFMHHVEKLIGGGTAQEIGIICVLLLRGPQTSGEINTRTDRLCDFQSTADVDAVLLELAGRTDGPFVTRLARQTGQKETRYMHLFFEETVANDSARSNTTETVPIKPSKTETTATNPAILLEKRIAALEISVKQIQEQLKNNIP